MPRTKRVDFAEPTPEPEVGESTPTVTGVPDSLNLGIGPLDLDLGRADLNAMVEKINELVAKVRELESK